MQNKNLKIKAFTFVELMVVITILAVLWAIWFSSYIWSIADTRDSQRKSDFAQVSSALKIYKQKRWYYSYPWDVMEIQYDWSTVALQWRLNSNVRLNSLDKLPFDPETKQPYFYSITKNKQEFELAWTLENGDNMKALLIWNYKSASKTILPTISLAVTYDSILPFIEIKEWEPNNKRDNFIYNDQEENLPYDFNDPFEPSVTWINFTDLLDQVELEKTYWQNTDFRNCIEIQEWWKALIPFHATSPFDYQIITETWALVTTWCLIPTP